MTRARMGHHGVPDVVAALALANAALMLGCPDPVQAPVRILPAEPAAEPLTVRIAVIADGQVHNLYSDPYLIHTSIADSFVDVAVRPPSLDLWALDILRETVALVKEPIVYLGDAADIACVGEFDAFEQVIDTSKKPWFFAPGNHDAFFVGNVHLATGDNAWGQWEKACRHAGPPLTKDLLVEKYLTALKGQPNADASIQAFAASEPRTNGSGHWQAPEGTNGMLARIAWHVDANPWASYVVQMLRLTAPSSAGPDVYLILLDTVDYESAPVLAGTHGSVRAPQVETVRSWLAAAEPDRMVVLAGHHPYASLEKDTRKRLDDLRRANGNPVYVSAHTHRGGFEVHEDDDRPAWIELNVGSITDWPQHYRTFALHRLRHRDGSSSVLMETPLKQVNEKSWFNGHGALRPEDCKQAWKPEETDPDYALAYNRKAHLPSESRDRVLAALLHAYERMLEAHATSTCDAGSWPAACSDDTCVIDAIRRATGESATPQLALIQELAGFERSRSVEDELGRREFRVCQALWASQRELLKVINPVVSDQWIQLSEAR